MIMIWILFMYNGFIRINIEITNNTLTTYLLSALNETRHSSFRENRLIFSKLNICMLNIYSSSSSSNNNTIAEHSKIQFC